MTTESGITSPTKHRILAAARACFSRDGFHGASMKSICKACEMSPGTLYHHFASKESLIQAIILEDQERAFARFENEEQYSNIVEQTVVNLLAVREEDRAQRSLVLEIMAEGMRSPLVAEMLTRKHEAITEMVKTRLEQAKTEGIIDADVDLLAAASLLLSLTYGLLADTDTGSPLTSEQRRQTLIDMIKGLLRIVS